MSPEFNSILSDVAKILNHVKANALNSRLFAALCEDAGSEHTQLILYATYAGCPEAKIFLEYSNYDMSSLTLFKPKYRIGLNYFEILNGLQSWRIYIYN